MAISQYTYVLHSINGKQYKFGSLTTPESHSAAGGLVKETVVSVGTTTLKTLWDGTSELITDFNYVLIATDIVTCYVNFICSSASNPRSNYLTVQRGGTTSGEWGIPLILANNYSFISTEDHTGTPTAIDKIQIYNPDVTQSVDVLLMLFT